MKNYIGVAAIAVVFAFIGYSFRPASKPDPDAGRFRDLKSKLENIGQVDIEEYLRLKEQKAKYEKADEILAKILQLMIYDLGLRQSEGQLARMKERVAEESPAPPPAQAPTAASATAGKAAVPPPPAAKAGWKENGEKAKEIYRADDVKEFLKSVEIPDFFGALKTGAPLDAAQVEMLDGNFTGRAVFDDPKEAPWNVQIVMNAEMRDGQAYGDFDVRLSKNGKQFSRTRSGRKRGEKNPIKTDNFMALDGDENSVIINAYGDDGYFQLYFFPRLNEFHGLVYLKKSLGVFERRGVVHLVKR